MNITINGQLAILTGSKARGCISYETIVGMSGRNPDRIFTVTWTAPMPGGSMSGTLTPGQEVALRDTMVFNVADTSNA